MKPEILSPCGGPESVAAAINSGCDAVYLGSKNFSARHNAVNFSDDELREAVRECHKNGVLVYLAINTVVFDDELRALSNLLKTACEAPVDGLIIQDMSLYEMVKSACPDMPLHASTQMTIHTPKGAEEAKALGYTRVVAARELSLKSIREMCQTGVEIEVFAHGALCMCVSGQCYLSAAMGGRSANRGLCAGACRLPFSAKGLPGDGDHALSLKDLSYCRRVGELASAGVASLKIEGRMKRPEYVAAATNALRKALDGEDFDEDILRAVFSRSGFTDSYLDDNPGPDMFGARLKEDVTAADRAFPEIRKIYSKPFKRFKAMMTLVAHPDVPLTLSCDCAGRHISLTAEPPETAVNRETTAAEAVEQLKKSGGTPYEISAEADITPGLMIKKSALNDLRRRALTALDEARISSFKSINFDPTRLTFDFPMPLILKHPRLRARVTKTAQLRHLPTSCEVLIPLSEAEEYVNSGYNPSRATLVPPRFDVDEKRSEALIKSAKSLGFSAMECGNLGQIRLARDLGMTPEGGFGLNVTNSLAARHYFFTHNLGKITLSPELTTRQASCIATPAQTGIIACGRLPLMVTRNCPIRANVGCKGCRGHLTDRTGEEFPVICRRAEGIYELLNTRPIWLADRLSTLNLDYADLLFIVESPEECAKIWQNYENELTPTGKFTRGFKIK